MASHLSEASGQFSSPASEIMNDPYLVGMIIPHLDTKTLLLANRICKDWKLIIDHSSEIQKKLFFKGDSRKRLIKCSQCDLVDGHGQRTGRGDCPTCSKILCGSQWPVYHRLNSLTCQSNACMVSTIDGQFGPRSFKQLKESSGPDGSWRRMFLCQPPVSVVDLHISYELSDNKCAKASYRIVCKEGVTWGLVMDGLARRAPQAPGDDPDRVKYVVEGGRWETFLGPRFTWIPEDITGGEGIVYVVGHGADKAGIVELDSV
ncbi:Hypothetical protein D9617_18g033060 [Elsinoe fawcettii]|nr:Hypothetical protein D9617_18g033060 [Elsinoe fawcettii]